VAAAAARLEKEGRYTATRRCIQHGKVSVYAHCVSVADTACVLAETLHLRVNERALIRGALLHDYFLYDWHDKANGHHWHGFTHPGTALHNASEDWKLTPVEREIIKKHMFPLTPIPPTCREAWLVCLADKICAANAAAVPQLPERCLSRKAGIVRCCLNVLYAENPKARCRVDIGLLAFYTERGKIRN